MTMYSAICYKCRSRFDVPHSPITHSGNHAFILCDNCARHHNSGRCQCETAQKPRMVPNDLGMLKCPDCGTLAEEVIKARPELVG